MLNLIEKIIKKNNIKKKLILLKIWNTFITLKK